VKPGRRANANVRLQRFRARQELSLRSGRAEWGDGGTPG